MKNVLIFDHPLIQHKLTILRDKNTNQELFRRSVEQITLMMGYEVTKYLPLENIEVETPVNKTITKRISGNIPFLVVIMRAGDGMKGPMLELLPTAKVGFVGVYRKETTKKQTKKREKVEIQEYYNKMPFDAHERDAIILDPMIASGTSASHAITLVKKAGVKNIKFMCLVACPEGIAKVTTDHPDVHFFCASMDEELLTNNYISPGLGDAGDRLFGTK